MQAGLADRQTLLPEMLFLGCRTVGTANPGDLAGLPYGGSGTTGVCSPAVCCRRWLVLWASSLPTCSAFGITCRRNFLGTLAQSAISCPCPTLRRYFFYTVIQA